MNKRQAERYSNITRALEGHGFTRDEVDALLRAGKVLHTWAEHECNGNIQRDDVTGKPSWYNSDGKRIGSTSDRETGAIKRCDAIANAHGLTFYHQSDPRGAQVYMVRPSDVPVGADIGAYYTRGICVCID